MKAQIEQFFGDHKYCGGWFEIKDDPKYLTHK